MSRSPFQHLIPEILGQIFAHSLPNDDKIPNPSSERSPLKLGRVCSHWREVSQRTPSLWCRLEITIGEGHEDDRLRALDTKYTNVVRIFMARASVRPVSIAFRCRETRMLIMPLTIKELLVHIPRCESFSLDASRGDVVNEFAKVLREGMPLLRSLEVMGIQYRAVTLHLQLDLDSAPLLSRIQVHNPCSLKLPSVTRTNVRVLQVTSSLAGISTWLKHCPLVESLDVKFDNLSTMMAEMGLPINVGPQQHDLSALTALTLGEGVYGTVLPQALLDCLCAPSLRILYLALKGQSLDPWISEFSTHLLSFLQRSRVQLEELVLHSPCVTADILLDILTQTPLLRRLDLCDDLVSDRIIEALIFPSSSCAERSMRSPLCPNVRQMKLIVRQQSILSEDVLIEMIDSRHRPTMGLEQGGNENESISAPYALMRLETVIIDCDECCFRSLEEHPIIVNCIDNGLEFMVMRFDYTLLA